MANNYVLLERIELNAAAASVTFSNIPQTGYTDLKLVWSARRESGAGYAIVDFNGLATANFSNRVLEGNGGSAYSFVSGNTNYAGPLDASTDTASTFSNCEMYIPNYTSANPKSFTIDAVSENNGTTAYADMIAGLWNNTAAITAVKLSPHNGTNFTSGSTFSLYGIAAVGTTPTVAPKADGGNVIATDGTYWYHTFLTNGTFTPQVGLSCDYLVVAGGGGAGSTHGGGGGAGGYLTGSTSVSTTSYTVTIGAGGAGGAGGSPNNGLSGSNSVFGAIIATSGGYGGAGYTGAAAGGAGGSSGGSGSGVTSSTAASPAGQGYAGGGGASVTTGGAGGGGGASAVGGTGSKPSASLGGNGGAGLSSSIDGTATVRAGGGGGGSDGGTAGTGGSGGGGNGSTNGTGSNGTVNTGSGGGGGGANFGIGGTGGSGIVIIRYAV